MSKFFLIILLSLTIFSCEVEFNKDLEDYIENTSERIPLRFSVLESISVNGELAYNFGFNIADNTKAVVVTNNEAHPVVLNSHSGLDGNFFMEPISGTTIEPGASIILTITYKPEFTANETVLDTLTLKDRRDRKFTLGLLGSSKRQPIVFQKDGEKIDKFDFGNYIGEEHKVAFELYNDGVGEIIILSDGLPPGLTRVNTAPISIPIMETRIVEFYFNGVEFDDQNIQLFTNFAQINVAELRSWGGSRLGVIVDEIDSSGAVIIANITSINFPLPAQKYFRVTNDSEFPMSLHSFFNSNLEGFFLLDFTITDLKPGENMEFQLRTDSLGPYSRELYIEDFISRRYISGSVTAN